MKKTVFLIALGVVTIGCICWGTIRHTGGYDGMSKSENDKIIDQKLESFSSISIDAGTMTLIIEEGPEFKIKGNVNREYLIPEISVNDGKLKITQNRKKPRFRTGYENSRVVIEIPSGNKLRSIDVDTGAGDLIIRDVSAEDLDFDINIGKITIDNVSFTTLRIDNNIGEVNLKPESDFNRVEINNNVGEISIYPIKESIEEYSVSLSTDVGDVEINGQHYKNTYNASGTTNKKITVNTNVGAIRVY